MPGAGPPSTPFLWFSIARRGCRASARHDDGTVALDHGTTTLENGTAPFARHDNGASALAKFVGSTLAHAPVGADTTLIPPPPSSAPGTPPPACPTDASPPALVASHRRRCVRRR